MSEGRPAKRRKQYLDRDKYFEVPASSLTRRLQAHAACAAAHSTASTAGASRDEAGRPNTEEGRVKQPYVPEDGEDGSDCDSDSTTRSGSDSEESITQQPSSPEGGDDDCNVSDSASSFGDFLHDDASSDGSYGNSDGPEGAHIEDVDNHAPPFSVYGEERLPHSQVTKAGAIAAVMSYALAHGLTWTALGDLTKLVNFLFGCNILPQSQYLFRKLWANETTQVLRYHYVCDTCNIAMEPNDDVAKCPICKCTENLKALRERGSFFIIMDLQKQLSFLIEQTKGELEENLRKLRQPAPSTNIAPSTISDITNAGCYGRLQKSRNLTRDDLTLTINTDGSPVFKSSKTSVWPLQFIVNELPTDLRFKHPVLAGLWFGKSHPNMQVFLDKFVCEVNNAQPVNWAYKSMHASKAYVLCCAVDAPARASVQNMVLFNGYFGCPWCLIRGVHTEGSMRYVTEEPVQARTSEMLASNMKSAVQFKDIVNGAKGPSALLNLKGLDLVNGQSVEYMHCVLQGVTRQLTETILASSNSDQRFYIGAPSTVARIDARLCGIKPPHCVTRLPRPLRERSYWKASEWRQWLLFYALPCLEGILRAECWKHFSKLSEAVHILLREELAPSDIDRAETLLNSFVPRCQTLYGTSFMTFNVHALQHLANCVRSLGPLWAHSAFVFESGNGSIVRLVSAANGLPQQITERVIMLQKLHRLLEGNLLTEEERQICKGFIDYTPVKSALRVNDLSLLGRGKDIALSTAEQDKIQVCCGVSVTHGTEYERFIKDKQVLHSTAYERPTKSDTTFVRTHSGCYKRIEKIIFLKEVKSCLLFCRPVIVTDTPAVPPHIKECFLSHDRVFDLVLPRDVADTCLFINFTNEEKTYICDLPNKIERD